MLTAILPLITVSLGLSMPAPELDEAVPQVTVTQPRSAQVRLAVTLAEADAIHAVGIRGQTIVFAIDREGEAFEVVATLRAKGPNKGEVIALSITDVGPAIGDMGSLSWLGGELADVTAVTVLAVDGDGAVTITTSDGRAYMAIPGRGSGGNAGVEARWAAAWDRDEG
ncbi:MAG: hypothetical protein H0T46_36525 [Deltaproteobacteria bacterium]|nr:hypothetical protein [Deltaproteobacteria bacterium]